MTVKSEAIIFNWWKTPMLTPVYPHITIWRGPSLYYDLVTTVNTTGHIAGYYYEEIGFRQGSKVILGMLG